MLSPARKPWPRYAGALVAVVAATLARLAMNRVLDDSYPLLTFFVAVVFAAWHGGRGPAVLALALCGAVIPAFMPPGLGSLRVAGSEAQVRLVAFFLVGLAFSLMAGSMHAAWQRLEAAAEAERETRRRIEQDVAEIRRAERALRASEARLRLALDAGRMGVWDWDVATGELWWSDNLEPIHGLEPGTFGGTFDDFLEIVLPDDRPRVSATITRSLEERSGYDVEFRVLGRDGDTRWISGTGKVFTAEDGTPARMMGVGLDVTDRKQSEERLLRSEQRFSRFMKHLPGLAWIKDLEGRYVYANEAALRAFRTSWTELEGRTDDEVFPSETAAQFRENDRRALASEAGVQTIEALMHEDGVLHHSLVSKFPVPGRDGTVALIGGMAIDITDRMAMEESLREVDRRKNEFLATLAHELRNPLAPVRNALHLMKVGADGGEIEGERAMAERQVAHLARLVDDLMDVSRINRGTIELRKEEVDLATIVRRAVESVRPTLRERGHELTLSLPDEPIRLDADPTRLEQVLGNLLHNAIKYTEPGGRIALIAAREGAEAVVRLRDTGIGIEPDMLPQIFGMFVQTGHHTAHSQGGLGIGLSLVKTLVEMHGGTILAESRGPGSGSEFVVRLPISPGDRATASEVSANGACRSVAKPRRRRILVVDDNEDAANSLARLLRKVHGQEVAVAYDGRSALALAESFRPEMVLLDIGLPDLDGNEVARRLRGHSDLADVVLIALTGWGQDDDRRKTTDSGFDRHLVKPLAPEILDDLLADGAPATG